MTLPTLRVQHPPVVIEAVPARGALVTGVEVAGRQLLYLDRASVDDTTRSVRGGIPLLFPVAGALAGNRLVPAGTTIPKHGFARHAAWDVAEQRAGLLRLRLPATGAMRAVYPYDFAVDYTLVALPRGAQVELHVDNGGGEPMPMSPGFHPYFRCASAHKQQVRHDVPGLDAARFVPGAEFDFGVAAPASGRARFDIPGLGELRLEWSPELRFLQCWSLPGRDFICLEPFTGPDDTVNTPARLEVPPGGSRVLWMRMELEG